MAISCVGILKRIITINILVGVVFFLNYKLTERERGQTLTYSFQSPAIVENDVADVDYYQDDNDDKNRAHAVDMVAPPKDDNKTMLILIQSWWEHENYKTGSTQFQECEETRCDITMDKSRIREADALVFLGQSYNFVKGDIPTYRRPDQKWIFVTREAPLRGYFVNSNHAVLRHAINLTATYRADADIQWPYGYYLPRTTPYIQKPLQRKDPKNAITWLISHCRANSQRMSYILDLQRYINVDIYGRCGPYGCPETGSCVEYLASKYSFYIAFENTDCEDYITEKVWENALNTGMVPIVRGTKTDFSKFLPPNSFIHAESFGTAEYLAKYIKYLIDTPSEYAKYFEWKKSYETFLGGQMVFRCNMCKVLHETRYEQRIADLDKAWNAERQCFKYHAELEKELGLP
ncbi:unnamed protein product [Owenia fusiformis]|uniref:Fucosyltransferase n=1 Tax=Owenia fusiformis TaxID=6347 RepID=A0A8J1XJ61_OWEFU|nr:unnamed protein product [Owenia fusiformis]